LKYGRDTVITQSLIGLRDQEVPGVPIDDTDVARLMNVGEGDEPLPFFHGTMPTDLPQLRQRCGHWREESSNLPLGFRRYGQSRGDISHDGPLGVVQEVHFSDRHAAEEGYDDDDDDDHGGLNNEDNDNNSAVVGEPEEDTVDAINTSTGAGEQRSRMVAATKQMMREKRDPNVPIRAKFFGIQERMKTADDFVDAHLALDKLEVQLMARASTSSSQSSSGARRRTAGEGSMQSHPHAESRSHVPRLKPATSPNR
jgi:hypothetical protein